MVLDLSPDLRPIRRLRKLKFRVRPWTFLNLNNGSGEVIAIAQESYFCQGLGFLKIRQWFSLGAPWDVHLKFAPLADGFLIRKFGALRARRTKLISGIGGRSGRIRKSDLFNTYVRAPCLGRFLSGRRKVPHGIQTGSPTQKPAAWCLELYSKMHEMSMKTGSPTHKPAAWCTKMHPKCDKCAKKQKYT